MAFDQSTRNRLQRFVGDARTLLTEECTRQLQHECGMNPATGEVAELATLAHLDDTHRETARLLRDTLTHYLATSPSNDQKAVLERIVRDQAFTVLNRLSALRMMEARGFLMESISKGYQSRGFQLYQRLAGPALGETGDAYRCYLFSLFDEFALDLAVLFDRFSPQGRLFPRESALLALLDLINHPEIEPLWAEDETIGLIYQYFNAQEERRQMRAASQTPRNSALKAPREIAMLDPACGAMHFGLYAFDLYETIYDEAWELEGQLSAASFARGQGLKPLREVYATKDDLRRDVPRLIIEHNVHGIDIDLRAAQIAGLSLWLRAQRSWQAQGVKPQQRPQIQRSNIVCAEPMPGEQDLLKEFTTNLQPRVLGQLVEHIFDKMQLAVVVWTPDEVEEWAQVPHAFITMALREGKALYTQSVRPCASLIGQTWYDKPGNTKVCEI